MKITSKNTGKILSWSDINVINGNKQSVIKKVVLTIEAGDMVTLEVEEYASESHITNGYGLPTKTSVYCVEKINIEGITQEDLADKNREEGKEKEMEAIKEKRLLHLNSISDLEI